MGGTCGSSIESQSEGDQGEPLEGISQPVDPGGVGGFFSHRVPFNLIDSDRGPGRVLLKSRIFQCQSFWACRGAQKFHFGRRIRNPPTPPGSSGCESPAGRLPLVPLTSGIHATDFFDLRSDIENMTFFRFAKNVPGRPNNRPFDGQGPIFHEK